MATNKIAQQSSPGENIAPALLGNQPRGAINYNSGDEYSEFGNALFGNAKEVPLQNLKNNIKKPKEVSLQNLKSNIGTESYYFINIFASILVIALLVCLVLYFIIYNNVEDDNNNDNNFKDYNIFSYYQGLGGSIGALFVITILILIVYNGFDKKSLCLEQKFLTDFSRLATTNVSLTDLRKNFKNYLNTKLKGSAQLKFGDIRKFGDMLSGDEQYLHQLPAYSIPSIFYDKVIGNDDFKSNRNNYMTVNSIGPDDKFNKADFKNDTDDVIR